MTLYWWTHWFWITSIIVMNFESGKYIEAYPLSPLLETNTKEYNHNSNNKRRADEKILTQFPLNDDEFDMEDIFNGRDSIPGAISLTAKSDSASNNTSEIAPTYESVIQRLAPRQAVNKNNFNNLTLENNDEKSNLKGINGSSIIDNITTFAPPELESSLNDDNNKNTTNKLIEAATFEENTTDMDSESISQSVTELMATSTSTTIAVIRTESEQLHNRFDDIKMVNDADKITMSSSTSGGNRSSSNSNSSINSSITSSINSSSSSSRSIINISSSTLASPPSEVDLIDNNSTPHKAPFTLENVNKEDELIRAENEHRSRKSKVLSAEYRHENNNNINFSSDAKNLLARSASSSLEFDESDDGNVSSEALSIQRAYFLDAGTISGICLALLAVCCAISFAGVVLYRRRYLNKPQTLSEPDSSVYIDDSTIRDNSDEMYSLDNDSFLNSLEAMTIQNYWTDTVKHTKL